MNDKTDKQETLDELLNSEIIKKGIERGYIKINKEKTFVEYDCKNKTKRRLNLSEEPVQIQIFLKLIFDYNYSPENIAVNEPVQIGSSKAEADIVVYEENNKKPLIVVECKANDITERQFELAIEQAYSYAHSKTAKYVWVTSGIKNEYFEISERYPVERKAIPDIPKKNKAVPQYKYVKGDENKSPEIIPQSKLKQIFESVHDALWGGGALSPTTAFDELDKLIFCKIWDEKWMENNAASERKPFDFQIITYPNDKGNAKAKAELFKRVKALYEEGRKRDPEVFKDDIKLTEDKVYTVALYLQDINISETDLDAKGFAFEAFMGSFFRGDFGQFFTPRNIVSFIVESLELKRDSRILDTSCGSGGFLIRALKEIRTQADELHKNKNKNTASYNAWEKYWRNFAEKNLYGIEINEQISRVAKMNMIIHDDGHTNVITNDALKLPETIQTENKNLEFNDNSFDFILTNPPFGSDIKASEKKYFKKYELAQKNIGICNLKERAGNSEDDKFFRPAQKTEILFFERCHHYLKENGFLAIVIPDGVLSNSSLQYVRDFIFDKFRIVSVVSLPQHTFTQANAGVKSSVLFLQKHKPEITEKFAVALEQVHQKFEECRDENIDEQILKAYKEKVFKIIDDYDVLMLEAENIGYDATGREIKGNELPELAKKVKQFIKDEGLI